ncbi:FecR domain-containing protein [Piscinibacter sakaiensis]|uniref:LysM domain-containing protein n=1 Tax=Piscinibacter sakaiensis TaxID=1547922 RepID=A0A0K8P746_PISS1|nr:FecR domain-containing protein [Piscinibacter sakaiensis]GAP38441.1 hypothetical protein ISF6_4899 [Piscinibacter sakaiensis]
MGRHGRGGAQGVIGATVALAAGLGVAAGAAGAATPAGPARAPASLAPAAPPPAPASASATPPAAGREWPYRIAAGDTLIGLAALYLQRPGDWPQVQRLNGIADPRRLVPGSVLRLPFDWLRRDAAVAEVVHVAGAVDLLRDGAPPQALAVPGERLRAGDALATGPGGAASLRFADGSRLLVVPGSRVTLERLLVYGRSGITDTGVRVDRGGADTRVEPNASRTPAFEVRTPAIHLGVRGTDFRVGVEDGGAARLEVLSGGVAAAAADAAGTPGAPAADGLLVPAGQGTQARRGEPVAPPRPLLPAPLAAAAGRVEQGPLRLDWTPVDGARGYRVQLFAAAGADALVAERRVDEPGSTWDADALPADGPYRWRVRAIDAEGLEGKDAEGRFELALRPFAPALQEPAPGRVVAGPAVRLRWAAPADGAGVLLQVGRDGRFDPPAYEARLPGREAVLQLPPGVYAWRVAALPSGAGRPAGARGPWGAVRQFDLRASPPPPQWEPPQLSPAHLLLRWRASAPGQGVDLQLARDPGFEQRLAEQRHWGGQLQLPRPAAGTVYARLRSVLGDSAVGDFGPPLTVEVPAVPWWDSLWLPRGP